MEAPLKQPPLPSRLERRRRARSRAWVALLVGLSLLAVGGTSTAIVVVVSRDSGPDGATVARLGELEQRLSASSAEQDRLRARIEDLIARGAGKDKMIAELREKLQAALNSVAAPTDPVIHPPPSDSASTCPYSPAEVQSMLAELDAEEAEEVERVNEDYASRGMYDSGARESAVEDVHEYYDYLRASLLAQCPQ